MVLTSEEMSILHGLINAAGSVSTYGYEVAVKGTVIEGIASLIIVLLAIIVTIPIARKVIGWAKKEGDDESYFWAVFGILLVFCVVYGISFLMFHGPIMSIGAPEYVVIDKILSAAASAAT